MSNLEKTILSLNRSLNLYVSNEETVKVDEQGEHIVRKVVPVKDLHSILQGESLLQGS
jgi:hypothetical protein